MDKQLLLTERMRVLRAALEEAQLDDPRIRPILENYSPFFDQIEAANIVPPWLGGYHNPIFGKDSVFENRYGMGSALSIANSDFKSALEDWPSRSSYRPDRSSQVDEPLADWRSVDSPPSLRRFLWRLVTDIRWYALRLKLTCAGWWRNW